MKIENKTNEEIKAHIVKMCDSYNKTGKDLYLKIKDECEAELQRRAQKKSKEKEKAQEEIQETRRQIENMQGDKAAKYRAMLAELEKKIEPQQTENLEQLPKEIDLDAGLKEIAKQEWLKIKAKLDQLEPIPVLPSDLQSAQSLLDKWAKEKQETRVIGTVTDAPIITVPVVEIALSSGTKQMNRTEIMTMLKTWFKRVATSKAMEEGRFSDAYGGAMGQDTYKLFQGWNVIYNETKEGAAWPPLVDVFPGLARASQQQKVNAEILWRWASNEK